VISYFSTVIPDCVAVKVAAHNHGLSVSKPSTVSGYCFADPSYVVPLSTPADRAGPTGKEQKAHGTLNPYWRDPLLRRTPSCLQRPPRCGHHAQPLVLVVAPLAGRKSLIPASQNRVARALWNHGNVGPKTVQEAPLLRECHPCSSTRQFSPCSSGSELVARTFAIIINAFLRWENLYGDKFKWAGNQEAVTFLGYRPIRS
jgi:hypothetical protein